MKVIVTVSEYAAIIQNTPQAVYKKISKGNFPQKPLVYKPFLIRGEIVQRPFINLTYLRDNDEQFLKFIDDDLLKFIEEKKWEDFRKRYNGIKVGVFAKYLDCSTVKIQDDVDAGIYPFVVLPGDGTKRAIRILKRETFKKYPFLETLFN